jgi:Tfp pilus assembly protein PilF
VTAARELATLSGHALTAAELRGFNGGSEALEKKHKTEELPVERVPAQVPAVPDDRRGLRRIRGPFIGVRLGRIGRLVVLAGVVVWLVFRFVLPRFGAANTAQAVTLTNQGVDSLNHGNAQAAQMLFENALRKDPRFARAMLNLGRIALDRNDDNLAAQHYSRALEVAGQDPYVAANAHLGLGELDMRAGSWSGAIEHLQTAMKLDSSQAAYYNNLGYALIMSGRATDGVNVIIRGIEAFPGEARLHKNLALGQLKQGDRKSAMQELNRALELDPTLSSAVGLMAQAKAEAGDNAGALNAWNRYVAMNPDPKEKEQLEAPLRARRIIPP